MNSRHDVHTTSQTPVDSLYEPRSLLSGIVCLDDVEETKRSFRGTSSATYLYLSPQVFCGYVGGIQVSVSLGVRTSCTVYNPSIVHRFFPGHVSLELFLTTVSPKDYTVLRLFRN